jgi:hypothetical protein
VIALVMAAVGASASVVGADAGVHALNATAKSPAPNTRMPPSAAALYERRPALSLMLRHAGG